MTDPVVQDLSERINASLAGAPVIPCPEPGVYEGVDFSTYEAWPAASNSALSKLYQSPSHLRAYLNRETEDSQSLVMGRAIHCAVLEPDDFAGRFGRFVGDRRTKEGKAQFASLSGLFGDGKVLKAEEFDRCVKVRDAVFCHRWSVRLLDGQKEVSIVWDDPASGVRCKARLDCYTPQLNGGAVVDLKSTRDASRRGFARAVREYGYYRQAAFYLTGARAVGFQVEHFVNIAVESDVPFNVQPYRMNEGAIDAGQQELVKLLYDYKRLMEIPRSEWPVGYSAEVEDVTLPDWSWSQIDEDLKGKGAA